MTENDFIILIEELCFDGSIMINNASKRTLQRYKKRINDYFNNNNYDYTVTVDYETKVFTLLPKEVNCYQ